MSDIEVIASGSKIVKGAELQIKTSSPQTPNITLDTTRIAEVSTNNYVLSSGGLYGSGYSGGIPGWLRDAIDNKVFESIDGTINLDNLTDSLRTLIEGSSEGVNQTIVRIENAEESLSGLITTLKSELENNYASIASVQSAYVTKDSASTTNAELQQSIYDANASTVLSLTNTFTSKDEARASSIDALSSTLAGKASASAVSTLNTKVGISEGVADGTGLLQAVSVLQKQNDGVIETIIDTYPVVDSNNNLIESAEPYKTWRDTEIASFTTQALCEASGGSWVDGVCILDQDSERIKHIGDVYIKYEVDSSADGKNYLGSYKFIRASVDSESPDKTDSLGYTWALVQDTDANNAYMVALNAADLADGKRRVFVIKPVSEPSGLYNSAVDPGDLWLVEADGKHNVYDAEGVFIQSTKNGEILRSTIKKSIGDEYLDGDWIKASRYTDDSTVNAIDLALKAGTYDLKLPTTVKFSDGKTFTAKVNEQLDGVLEVFEGSDEPTDPADYQLGDLYLHIRTATSTSDVEFQTIDIYELELVNSTNAWVKKSSGNDPDDLVALRDETDGQKAIFNLPTVPGNSDASGETLNNNDMWIPSANVDSFRAGEIYFYDKDTDPENPEWKPAQDYKVETFYADTPPSTHQSKVGVANSNSLNLLVGDVWLCTKTDSVYTSGDVYVYSRTPDDDVYNYGWIEDSSSKYTGLFDKIDGKAAIYSTYTIPSGEENDMWIPENNIGIRYIRDWTNGSTANSGDHWVEIKVIDSNGDNVALGKTVSTEYGASNLPVVTDGLLASASYASVNLASQAYVEIDLGAEYTNIDYIQVWHYYADGRTYHETRTEVSDTGSNWINIFDSAVSGEYVETDNGKIHSVPSSFSKEIFKCGSNGSWYISTRYAEDLYKYKDAVVDSIDLLSKQRDGLIRIYKGTSFEMASTAADLTSEDDDGDVFINTEDKSVYYWNTDNWNLSDNSDELYKQYKDLDVNAFEDGLMTTYYSDYEIDASHTIDTLRSALEGEAPLSVTNIDSAFGKNVEDTPNKIWNSTQKHNNIGNLWVIGYVYTYEDTEGEEQTKEVTITFRWSGSAWYELQDGVAFVNSEAVTSLDAQINDPVTGLIKANSTLEQSISIVDGIVDTTFAYDTETIINGIYYKSGFGLETTTANGDGNAGSGYDSEFWINAEKFKFTNSDKTGSNAVFSIDTTGTTPQVTFNGKVSFNSVTDVPEATTVFKGDVDPLLPMTVTSINPHTYSSFIGTVESGKTYTITYTLHATSNGFVSLNFYDGVFALKDRFYISFPSTSIGTYTITRTFLNNSFFLYATHDCSVSVSLKRVPPAGSTWEDTSTTPLSTLKTYVDGAWVENGTPGAVTTTQLATKDSTVIHGGNISTGTIDAARIFTEEIVMKSDYTGVISNASQPGGSDYTMKIDFLNGSIHIK